MTKPRAHLPLGKKNWHKPIDVPEGGWNVALERTAGLAETRLQWDANLHNLLANAYLQGACDVSFSPDLIESMRRMHDEELAQKEAHAENYHGA